VEFLEELYGAAVNRWQQKEKQRKRQSILKEKNKKGGEIWAADVLDQRRWLNMCVVNAAKKR
jgi:hypothetical protein